METQGAKIFNDPISLAIGDSKKHFMITNCIEDVLDYPAPSRDKPFKAYEFINRKWGSDWDSISPKWSEIVERIFYESFEKNGKLKVSK